MQYANHPDLSTCSSTGDVSQFWVFGPRQGPVEMSAVAAYRFGERGCKFALRDAAGNIRTSECHLSDLTSPKFGINVYRIGTSLCTRKLEIPKCKKE